MNPIYTQRRGTTYAISETDLMHIETFTSHSSRLYSLSGFFVGILLDILIAYGGGISPLSQLAEFWLRKGSWAIGAAAFVFFVWGYTVTLQRNKVLDQIRRECGVEPHKGIIALVCLSFRRRVENWLLPKQQSPE